MTSRRLIATLLLAAFTGSAPVLALELEREDSGALSASDATVAASSSCAEARVPRGLDVTRPPFTLAAPAFDDAAPSCAPPARVSPRPRATKPELVTCPSQAP